MGSAGEWVGGQAFWPGKRQNMTHAEGLIKLTTNKYYLLSIGKVKW